MITRRLYSKTLSFDHVTKFCTSIWEKSPSTMSVFASRIIFRVCVYELLFPHVAVWPGDALWGEFTDKVLWSSLGREINLDGVAVLVKLPLELPFLTVSCVL